MGAWQGGGLYFVICPRWRLDYPSAPSIPLHYPAGRDGGERDGFSQKLPTLPSTPRGDGWEPRTGCSRCGAAPATGLLPPQGCSCCGAAWRRERGLTLPAPALLLPHTPPYHLTPLVPPHTPHKASPFRGGPCAARAQAGTSYLAFTSHNLK